MQTPMQRFLGGTFFCCLMTAIAAQAAEPNEQKGSAPKTNSLEAQLLDDLPPPSDGGSRPQNEKANAKSPAGEDIGSAGESNPLAAIGQRMRTVEARIARGDTSPDTQALQKQIINELAQLAAQASKQEPGSSKAGNGRGSQSGSVGGNPTPGPPQDSTKRLDPGEIGAVDTANVQDVIERYWGHLPEKMREQMQSSLSEEFLPKYQRVIEEYYKRLAEERRERQ